MATLSSQPMDNDVGAIQANTKAQTLHNDSADMSESFFFQQAASSNAAHSSSQ